jgi:hypothetical protein
MSSMVRSNVHSVPISNMGVVIVKRSGTACRGLREHPAPSESQRFLTSSAGTDSRGGPDEGQNVRLRDSLKAYHLDMRRLHPECSDSESSDRSLPADILLREEPENEEEEEEEDDDEHHGGEEDDDGDEGYSE